MNGHNIRFEVRASPANGYLALPSQPDSPGVIVLHAWWGLNDMFRRLCDRLAAEGFAAFAPDLYHGEVVRSADEAARLVDSDMEWKQAVVTAAPDFLRARPEVQKAPLSLIGFSMGAAWSLLLASERPADIHRVVLFYGSYGVDFSKIRASILGHFADVDEWEPLDGVRAMEADLRAAGLEPSFHIYSNARHWFFEEDRPEFDPPAAELAWARTLEFLHRP